MNNENIERMVHRIRGIFPSQQISFNAVIETWQEDAYLQSVSTEEARKAMPMVEALGKCPSLPQMRDMIRKANSKEIAQKVCADCSGNGFITGIDLMLVDATADPKLQYKMVAQPYKTKVRSMDHEYSYVTRCKCSPM
jgi:excinuclease UvrABC ATPase subunit